MTPELETYFNNYNELFNHSGFKQLLEELSNNIEKLSDLTSIKDVEELFFRKGQIAAFNAVINLEGTVSATREQAEERGMKVTTGKIPMSVNARYLAEHPGERGLCKVVIEEGTRRLLGVHMIGGACSEMIFGAAAMLETELREEEIDEIVFPHPTTSEVMKDVFMAVR